jgi:hypothetical protein
LNGTCRSIRWEPYAEELEKENISFVPLILETYGHMHESLVNLINEIGFRKAKEKGLKLTLKQNI